MDIQETKAQIRKEVIARRNAIPAAERGARSERSCKRLADHFATSLMPEATLAGYSMLGSEVDLTLFLEIALQHQCHVCLPCMVRDIVERTVHDHHNCQCGHEHDHPHHHDYELVELVEEINMVFFEIDRQMLLDKTLPFIADPARSVDAGDPCLLKLKPIKPDDIDIVITPLVAFDKQHARLGYGGGNYDRLLANLLPFTSVAGIAFSEQEVPLIPTEPHDLPVPYLEIA